MMELKRPLPSDRTYEQVMNHYLVEKAIVERIKNANPEERKAIYATMYDELFSQVPDHPRLTRRVDERLTRQANSNKLAILKSFLNPQIVFTEFAPGDCKFVISVAPHVSKTYGIDISDQRNPDDESPANFELIVYDGYNLDSQYENLSDIVFSDQLIEHFHPEETRAHFEMVRRMLKPGGKYVFRTPHAYRGPEDVSGFFCDEPEGFHLKEWTYGEIRQLLEQVGYSRLESYWSAKGIAFRLPFFYFTLCEGLLGLLPRKLSRAISKYALPSLFCVAVR